MAQMAIGSATSASTDDIDSTPGEEGTSLESAAAAVADCVFPRVDLLLFFSSPAMTFLMALLASALNSSSV